MLNKVYNVHTYILSVSSTLLTADVIRNIYIQQQESIHIGHQCRFPKIKIGGIKPNWD
jgi:hypothetical protein